MKITRLSCAIVLLTAVLCIPFAAATPANTAELDGRPREYDAADLRASTDLGIGNFGGNNLLTNLFVTWDADYLYIALQGDASTPNNKLVIMLDVDPGNGTGATSTTNWGDVAVTQDYLKYNDVGWAAATDLVASAFGLDYMIASEGFYNNLIRVSYNGDLLPTTNNTAILFDNGNASAPVGTPIDMATYSSTDTCPHKGIEARIPWSELYHTNRFGEVGPSDTVPTGATLRVFANIHNNSPNDIYSADNIIPEQTSILAVYTGGVWTTDDYVDVIVDGDDDGAPDLASIDENAPYIRTAIGLAGKQIAYVLFNEDVTQVTLENTANWMVGTDTPSAVQQVDTRAALLTLTNPLPAAGTLTLVAASNVEDANGNVRAVEYCLDPAASGIETSITVRLVLETASGMGLAPLGASNFYVNGSTPPLEWGFPPATTMMLTNDSGTIYAKDIVFPPGSPTEIYYKYSAELDSTGTNNYEAVRLDNFDNVTRVLTLNTNGTTMVRTDYLGAAAAPLRNPADTNVTAFSDLYYDAQRGDAGVQTRRTILFQVDLSARNLATIDRVAVLGTDPLRGFNVDDSDISDYGGQGGVGWDKAGIELYDDGSNGDETASDGIFSREWAFSIDGTDNTLEPSFPYSLVGGGGSSSPYGGFGWESRRSPKSFKYKFYAVTLPNTAYESPATDIDVYLETDSTNIILDPFVWDNEGIPPPPPSNSPTMLNVAFTGGIASLVFTNEPSEGQHGVQISTNLTQGWLDYGHRAALGSGLWHIDIEDAEGTESYRAFAGSAQPFSGVRWDPNPMPSTGGTMRIYFTQHNRALAGDRNVQMAGSFNGWTPAPMTFVEDGTWYYDAIISEADSSNIIFKARSISDIDTVWCGMNEGGDNYRAYKGEMRASWAPNTVTNGELMTITYDAAGGGLEAATSVFAHVGFDETPLGWEEVSERQMTNTVGTVWELAFPVPSNHTLSVNFVFNGYIPPSGGQAWDGENDGGRQWRAFIAE